MLISPRTLPPSPPHTNPARTVVFCSLYVWPFYVFPETSKAVAFALTPITIYSLCFMITTQVNHHSEETSSPKAAHSNWYRHQTSTSHAIVPASRLANSLTFWFMGGLNLQTEHHLFPCVNHWHLRKLQPLIEAAARQHGAAYPRSSSLGEALGKLWSHLAILGDKPKK